MNETERAIRFCNFCVTAMFIITIVVLILKLMEII